MNKLICLLILALCANVLYGQNDSAKIHLSLESAIELALKNNPEIIKTKYNVAAAKGKYWSSVTLPMPVISANYDFVPLNKSLDQYEERTYGISQSFDFPTNYFLYGKQASAEIYVAEAEFRQIILRIRSEVKTAYYSMLAKQLQQGISIENMQTAEEFFKKAESRYNAGEAANIELLTARVQRLEAKNAVEITSKELRSAESELSFLLAESGRSTNRVVLTDSLSSSEISTSLEKILAQALKDNPLVKKSEWQLRSSSARNQLAWSSLLPSFEISYSRQAMQNNADYYGVNFGMSIPLWFMFDQKGKIQEASAVRRGAEAELALAKNSLRLDITNAYSNLKNEERQLKLYKNELLPQADEIYKSASLSYNAGELTYLELLQAKQTSSAVKTNYVNALLNYNIAAARLEFLAGSGIYDTQNLED